MRRHPETGRKALYVNRTITVRINELTGAEGRVTLAYLFDHAERPDLLARFRWQPNSAAFWDNRAVRHMTSCDQFP